MALALLVLACGCHRPLATETPRFMREQGRFAEYARPAAPEPEKDTTGGTVSGHLYITAIRGNEIVLFRDGEEIAAAPAGENPDPDRHRVMGGHLWSDAIEGKQTVVFRDGEEWLRFDGEELFKGFLLREGVVYTLGQRPGSQGLCYRIDGKEVFSDASGRIVGSMKSREWDGVSYCYGIPIPHGSSTTWEYRIMKGAETVRILADDAVGTVLDMYVAGSSVYRLEKRGDDIYYVSPRGAFRLGEAAGVSIVKIGDDVCVRGHNPAGTACWYRYNSKVLAWEDAAELYYDGSLSVWWTLDDGLIDQFFFGETALDIACGRFFVATPACAGFFGPTFCAALTDTIGQEHLIVTGNSIVPFNLEGTLTSIRIE
jgi:hypothetical protein